MANSLKSALTEKYNSLGEDIYIESKEDIKPIVNGQFTDGRPCLNKFSGAFNTLHKGGIEKGYLAASAKEKTEKSSEDLLILEQISRGETEKIWKLLQRHCDYLYWCCFDCMNGNYFEAEDAFSRAKIKAWEQLPKHSKNITKIRAWLARLASNTCMDIHRERNREAKVLESIESMAVSDKEAIVSKLDSPDDSLLRREMAAHIRSAIKTLPSRLSEPFILRFCQEKSYPAIAKQLGLSESNVRKCIQQARVILQQQLNHYYLLGLDDYPCLSDSSPPLPKEVEDISQYINSNQPACGDREIPATQTGVLFDAERISYGVTASCLEALPHIRSPLMGSLGWR